jgi:CRP/FNR family cyclic AMP-dependent transcriptional regulator
MTQATPAHLKKLPLFSTLGDEALGAIAPLFTVRAYPKGAIVVSEDEAVQQLIFILSGRTRHFLCDEQGQEMDLIVLGPGEWMAAVSMIGATMVVSSIAVEPLVVTTVRSEDFERCCCVTRRSRSDS